MIRMNVEKDIRDATAIHHSSTHLMHAALKQVSRRSCPAKRVTS